MHSFEDIETCIDKKILNPVSRKYGTSLHAINANIGDQELGLLHVDMEPFTFHANLPHIELGDTLLLGVQDKHHVISVEKLPWDTSAELSQKCLQHQDEQQWSKDRALMHVDTYAQILTVLTIDPHTTLGMGAHALNDMQSPFLGPGDCQGPP